MGLAIAVEAVVAVVEAAEAAGAAVEAGEGIASGVEAGEAITAGSEAGADAGTDAGTAAAEEGDAALEAALDTLAKALQKLANMVKEYIVIDAVFKAAKAILDALTDDPAAKERAKKLVVLVDVLTQSTNIIEKVNDWMQDHAKDTTKLQGIEVPVEQGVLAKFLAPLGAAAKTLQALSQQVGEKNVKKDPITDGEVEALETGLTTVLSSLLSLAQFKEEQEGKVPELSSIPISSSEVTELQARMP